VTVHLGETRVEALRGSGGWRLDGAMPWGFADDGTEVTVFAGHGLRFARLDPLARGGGEEAGADLAVAPMPGRVVSVHVRSGQAVEAGDRLCVLEAMKMEHALRAARAGVVAEVLVREGDQVEAGAPLVRLEEEET
jgi:3-methylcrotonyl-CoA carboxylase alpha subunit